MLEIRQEKECKAEAEAEAKEDVLQQVPKATLATKKAPKKTDLDY